jgi:hypothetical protein
VTIYITKKESFIKWFRALQQAAKSQEISEYYQELPDQVLGQGSRAKVYKGVSKKKM